VPPVSREFVLHEPPGNGADVLNAVATGAISDGIAWANGGRASTHRRTWLDTFDWRLYRAGLTFEQLTTLPGIELTLTGRDGDVLAAERLPRGVVSWPSLVSALPPGPLRELLEPVLGVRALLPVARAASKVAELRALNADAKTIARLAVDRMSVSFPARGVAPARLILAPVRGYQGQADRAARLIAAMPGVSSSRGSALDAALAAAGYQAGEHQGKAAGIALTPQMPAATALAAILAALLDALEANVPGTVRDIDTEFLHDLRIAVRWTRSALKLCGSALPGDLADRFRPEFRWLGDLTTPTRDLDVYLLGFDGMAAALVGATESELAPFRDHLLKSRAVAYRQLVRGLRSAQFRRLSADWRAALTGVHAGRKRPTVAELADARIAAAQRKALRAGALVTATSPAERLHDVRKRCKELRYVIEMFGSLHEPAQRWQAIRELKALQDCLGEFQDTEVQRAEIRAFAAQMLADRSAPAETLLAMGEVAAGLAVRQQAARARFDGRFAAFAGPASQARLTALARTSAS
jgi:CHAD domain-containing protein